MMWNPCCDCNVCSCQGCDFEECDCESCEDTCRDENRPKAKKRRIDVGDPSKLYAAIMNGDKSKICEIVKKENVNLRKIYNNGNRALHLVFLKFQEKDIIEILKAFISKKVNLYFKNKNQESVLHIAVAKKMKNAIDFLLRKDFKIEMIYKRSNPMPHFVIDNEYRKFMRHSKTRSNGSTNSDRIKVEIESADYVEWLIAKGFDFDRQNESKQSALYYSIEKNLQHILPTLLKHSNDISYISNDHNRTLLHSFVTTNDLHKNRTSIHGFGVWSDDYVQRYTAEIIKIMLDKGVSVDAVDNYGFTVLHMAVRTNVKMGIFEMLLDCFTNVHQESQNHKTVLYEVARMASWADSNSEAECYVRIMQSLIAKGADVNFKCENGATPFSEVVIARNIPAVVLMKNNNADFKITPFGYTLLHFSARKKLHDPPYKELNEGIFDLLIGEFPDVNVLDKDGETPLHAAIRCCNTAIARKLIANGADVNCRDNKRQMTPLLCAVEYEYRYSRQSATTNEMVETAVLMIDKGANLNSKAYLGMRPVDWAASASSSQILQVLLKRGAYVHTRDKNGETALFRAVRVKNPANIEELLRHGANINEPCVLRLVELFYKENHNGVIDPVLQHWIKLEAANLPCLKEYRALIKDAEYQKFYQGCLEEIELLKSSFVGDQTTLYSFLRVHPNRRCAYAYCEMLRKHVESPSFEKQFPKYSVLIEANYRTAIARKSLADKAKQVWQEATEIILPDVCIERILAFLNNADLVDMVE